MKFDRLYLFGGVILLTFIFFKPGVTVAQEKPLEVGFKLISGIPMQEFNDHIDKPGYGFEVHVGYPFDHVPLTLGYEFSYLGYGRNEINDVLNRDTLQVKRRIVTGNNIASLRMLARVGPQFGVIRPYIDGFTGINYYYTVTHFREKILSEKEAYSRRNFDDFAWTYGLGAGLKIKVQEIDRIFALEHWYFDMRVVYERGESARFIAEKPAVQSDGTVIVAAPERAPVNILSLQAGFTIYFSN